MWGILSTHPQEPHQRSLTSNILFCHQPSGGSDGHENPATITGPDMKVQLTPDPAGPEIFAATGSCPDTPPGLSVSLMEAHSAPGSGLQASPSLGSRRCSRAMGTPLSPSAMTWQLSPYSDGLKDSRPPSLPSGSHPTSSHKPSSRQVDPQTLPITVCAPMTDNALSRVLSAHSCHCGYRARRVCLISDHSQHLPVHSQKTSPLHPSAAGVAG